MQVPMLTDKMAAPRLHPALSLFTFYETFNCSEKSHHCRIRLSGLWPPPWPSLLWSLGLASESERTKMGGEVWWHTGEAEARGSGVQGQPWLCTKFEASLSYIRPALKLKEPPPSPRYQRKKKKNLDTIFSKTKLKFVFVVFCTSLPILMGEQHVP